MKDITIIGAGPVGLYASFYASLRQMSVTLIESMPNIGGQLTALYGDKYIYDLPGYTKILAKDFIANLEDQLENSRKDLVDIHYGEEVVEIRKKENYFEILTSLDNVYSSKSILIAVGNGVFSPRRIGFENEHKFDNILYSVSDINKFKDKNVTILGGGDSALDWSLMLHGLAKNVNIVHRRHAYRAKEDTVLKLNETNVKQYMNYVVDDLIGVNSILNEVVIMEKESHEKLTLSQDYLLVNYGNITKVSDFGGLDLEKASQGYNTNRLFETTMEGIYACGNATYYDGKPKLITVGLGEVPIVINNIKGYVDPSSKGKVFFSSTSTK